MVGSCKRPFYCLTSNNLLLAAYFQSFNSMFPLLNRTIFDRRFDQQYSGGEPPNDVAWFSCFNMVLAYGSSILAGRYPLNDPLHPVEDVMENPEEPSFKYLRNATSTMIDLQFGGTSLSSVQAIMLIVSSSTTNSFFNT